MAVSAMPKEEGAALIKQRGRRMSGPSFLANLDWAKFEKDAAPHLKLYDPPQFQGSSCTATCFNHRSKCCTSPSPPCCCASLAQRCICCGTGVQHVKLSEPDSWFPRMLKNLNPKTPEWIEGLYWMEDNTAPEVLMTFQSMDWLDPQEGRGQQGYIMPKYNWTNDDTCFGTFCGCINAGGHNTDSWPFYISPSGRWININPQWIYVFRPGDELFRPDGTQVEILPGDMMRMAFHDNADPTSGVAYQYLVRRVAYMERNTGELVKTKHYDHLKSRAMLPDYQPSRLSCCCCGLCDPPLPLTANQVRSIFEPLSDHQIVQFAPPMQEMWPDVEFSQ